MRTKNKGDGELVRDVNKQTDHITNNAVIHKESSSSLWQHYHSLADSHSVHQHKLSVSLLQFLSCPVDTQLLQ